MDNKKKKSYNKCRSLIVLKNYIINIKYKEKIINLIQFKLNQQDLIFFSLFSLFLVFFM